MNAVEALDYALRLIRVRRNDAEDNAIQDSRFIGEYEVLVAVVEKLEELKRRELRDTGTEPR